MSELKPTSSNEKSSSHGASMGAANVVVERKYATQRTLSRRQVQLFSIGGVIGTAVFISIGGALTKGGPLFLLLGYTIWSAVIYCVNEGQAEMVCERPIDSSFNRFAAQYVHDAMGAASSWNYALCMTSLLCFEVTALTTVLGYWSDNIHPAIIPAAMLASYAVLHLWSARWFGESEFWVVLFKITLMLGLFLFTFVTMLGGNPINDRFGFRAWRDPGPIAKYRDTSDASGYFQGFWACLLSAAFAVAGPDMLSMIAGETINPRVVMPVAFRTVFIRLIVFFVFSALAVGILVASNDPILLAAINDGLPGAGRSPYVAAMNRLKVKVLPHIVNAGICTSIYSAGSAFFFNGSRTIHALAVDGYAPAFLKPTNRNGVPWVACLATLAVGCLSFLQVSSGTSKVLDWFINIATATQLVAWMGMSITYLFWRRAYALQGYSRNDLNYKSWCQPYAAWIGLICSFIVTLGNGYAVFRRNSWSTPDFIFAYFAPLFFIFVFLVRLAWKRQGFVKPLEINLFAGVDEIEEHELSIAMNDEEMARHNALNKWGKFKAWML